MSIVPLVAIDSAVASSYSRDGKTGGARTSLTPLAKLGKAGVATPDTAAALLALHNGITAAGGDFRVTEMHRDVGVQKAARAKYDAWVKAGKPKPGTSSFDAKTMKAAFVAAPGRSMHNAGRAIDVHLGMLAFPGVPADMQLDRLWEIAVPLGWKPIIKSADERASEAWHFDYVGDLAGVLARLGYEQAALCGALLVGHADLDSHAARVQALLSRAGYDLGAIDGVAGARTFGALATALGVTADAAKALIASGDTTVYAPLYALPAR